MRTSHLAALVANSRAPSAASVVCAQTSLLTSPEEARKPTTALPQRSRDPAFGFGERATHLIPDNPPPDSAALVLVLAYMHDALLEVSNTLLCSLPAPSVGRARPTTRHTPPTAERISIRKQAPADLRWEEDAVI